MSLPFDRAKILAEGGKYYDAKNMLTERADLTITKVDHLPLAETGNAPAYLKEDASLPKRMVIEGVFQRAGVRNANGREYPMTLWERLLDENGPVMTRVRERAMIGHLEHPETGTTDLNKGAILITKVWMEKDGTVMGRAIVYNTPEGLRLQEYIETGTKVGISSRGTGTVDAKGVVCEDFALETWDMVYNPSTPGAHPTRRTESSESPVHTTPVVENRDAAPIIPPQDTPMSLSKRISEARGTAQALLAVDPKRLDETGRTKLAGDLLDLRVKLAKEFIGEERVPEVDKVLKDLDAAKTVAEEMSDAVGGARDAALGAPEGQVKTGIPGIWDALDKVFGGMTDATAKTKALESAKTMADLIAANIGKLPQVVTAVENAIKETTAELSAEHRALLSEARDEITLLTERLEASSAIITEMQTRCIRFQGEVQESKLREEKLTKTVADLTSVDNAGRVREAVEAACKKHPALTAIRDVLEKLTDVKDVETRIDTFVKGLGESAKPVDEAKKPDAAPAARKSLTERLADLKVPETKDGLPKAGTKVESAGDAGDVEDIDEEDAKKDITESKESAIIGGLAKALKGL